jgi:hypothetical protein
MDTELKRIISKLQATAALSLLILYVDIVGELKGKKKWDPGWTQV